MIPEVWKDVIEKLNKKTKENKVIWKPTNIEAKFIIYFKGFALSIFHEIC